MGNNYDYLSGSEYSSHGSDDHTYAYDSEAGDLLNDPSTHTQVHLLASTVSTCTMDQAPMLTANLGSDSDMQLNQSMGGIGFANDDEEARYSQMFFDMLDNRSGGIAYQESKKELDDLIFAPSVPQGEKGLATTSYRMEAADPKHRMGDVLSKVKGHYETLQPPMSFWDWLDSFNNYFEWYNFLRQAINTQGEKEFKEQFLSVTREIPNLMRGVEYLCAVARGNYQVEVHGSKFYRNNPSEPLSTEKMSTVFSGKGWGIWVRSPSDTFFTNSHRRGGFHHSSFLSGGNVRGAGEWKVVDGELRIINGKTGHYQARITELQDTIRLLQKKGLSLHNTSVIVWKNPGANPELAHAMDFLQDPQYLQYSAFGTTSWQKKPAVEKRVRQNFIGCTHRFNNPH